ncbi:hypothetical protein KC909_02490 [Candidatus Dojkabacteria bacterium]|uniref:Uncharacterized protein n=1 Tax=Candidatus Dojkabacteria bacterium TaxID=2099670 RepID=A0A955L5D3_9BACT|nr:hypothetical protein [Candidatus Dojkabacteria bacterium]
MSLLQRINNNKYFGYDKPLRHYTQHLIVASIGYLVSFLLIGRSDWKTILTFVVFTYLIDLDGLVYLIRTMSQSVYSAKIKSAIRKLDFEQAMILATTHHKKFNGLLLHNWIGLLAVILLVIVSYNRFELLFFASMAILSHFIFDIIDDFWQLGHLRNWFSFGVLSNLTHNSND